MNIPPSSPLILFAICLLALVIHRTTRTRQPLRSLPPGPPPLPLLGNLHQIPTLKAFLKFTSWSRHYGPIYTLHLGSTPVIVLSSWRVVRNLLDQRGAIYSSRPDFPIVSYIVPNDNHAAFMKYGARWRKFRRTVGEFLKESVLERCVVPIQEAESCQMMWEILWAPERYHDHLIRYFSGVILASVYGVRAKTYRGSFAQEFFETQDAFTEILDPGQTPPYQVFPWLRWVPDWVTPWKGWTVRADAIKKRQRGLYIRLFEETKRRLEMGIGAECHMGMLLGGQEKEGYTDEEVAYIGGFLMEGGSDTTFLAFLTFVLAMAAYPEVQRRLQEEVDGAYGDERMPGTNDGVDLPFLKACFWEVLRWRPGFTTAIPHATTQDDTYQGHFIPAGTTVIQNTWAINHDPEEFEDPDDFKPSRYLSNKYGSKNAEDPQEAHLRKESYSFGASRRICAGQRMAENSMMTTMSKLVWAFDVVADGKLDTDVKTAWKDAILSGPKDFSVGFRVRGEKRKAIIEKRWREADEYLKRFE